MQGPLLVLLGLLAFSCASVIQKTVESHDGSSYLNADVGDHFKNLDLNFPRLETPSEEEWIELIEGTFTGAGIPNFLAEKNYTFHANDTGCFNNSDGFKGNWTGRAYIHYRVEEDQIHEFAFSVQVTNVSDFFTGSAAVTVTTYTKATHDQILLATVRESANFDLGKNHTYKRTGGALSFTDGVLAYDKNAGKIFFGNIAVSVSNSSHHYTLSGSQSQGMITPGKEKNTLEGLLAANSYPLFGLKDMRNLPKDPEALAKLLKASETGPHYSGTQGRFYGDFIYATKGDYNSASQTYTVTETGAAINSTSRMHGLYWEVNAKELDEVIQLHGLLGHLIDPTV